MSWERPDRRQFVRARFPCDLSFQTPQEDIIHTQTENISAGGIRVFTHTRLAPASLVTITIYKIRKDPIICKGKIIWIFSRKHPVDTDKILFDTGIEFYQLDPETALLLQEIIQNLIIPRK